MDILNSTYCDIYVPDSDEYHKALGALWVSFIVIGSITTILLYALFLEQLSFAVSEVHSTFRKYLIWISSVYPFMTLMSLVGFAVPRSQQVCSAVKILYMTIGISNFADLTVLLYGSEEVMLWTLKNSSLQLQNGPLCCCCFCLPTVPVTKKGIRGVLYGVYQLPFTQAFYLVMVMILQSADQIVMGSLDPAGSYVWLSIFVIFTSLLGVYCLNILSTVSQPHLQRYFYKRLSFVFSALIIVTKMQSLAFGIMAHYGVFPCIPPISRAVYKETIENCLYILEMFVFGIYSYVIYRRAPLRHSNPKVLMLDSRGQPVPHHKVFLRDNFQLYGARYPGTDILDDTVQVQFSELRPATEEGYDFSADTLVIGQTSKCNSQSKIVLTL